MQPGIAKPMIVVLALVALAAGPETQPQSLSVLLEKGVYLEETAGNPKGAIEVYQQVVEGQAKDRALAAQALYRIGQCQVKLEQREQALEAFREAVRLFPEQKELAAKATAEIEKLGGTLEASQTPQLFPELVNCQLKYTIPLKMEQARSMPLGEISLYELSLIDFEWTLPAELEKRVAYWCIVVAPYDPLGRSLNNEEASLWTVMGVPPATRRASYGQKFQQLVPKGVQKGGEPLKPGEYLVFIGAYDNTSAPNESKQPFAVATAKLVIKPLGYTQIYSVDVQADGSGKYVSVQQNTNHSDRAMTETGFNTSDNQIEAMFDEQQQPLRFTMAPDAKYYHYNVTFNRPVPPDAPYMLKQEGRMACTAKALDQLGQFKYRAEHWPGSENRTRRVQFLRLPAGARLEQAAPGMIQRTRDGRIELVADQIVEPGGSIYVGVQYDMGCESALESEEFKPARRAAEQWLTLVDEHNYEEAYRAAGPPLHKRWSQTEWVEELRKGHDASGRLISRRLAGARIERNDAGRVLELTWTTSYANTEKALERMTLIPGEGDAWLVCGYSIHW